MPCKEAIVLVGGLGTRLRPVVSDVPKPLASVAGRPFLAWVLDSLAGQGMERCVLATGYMWELIREQVGIRWQDMRIDYSVESTPLGTGGAVALAAAHLRGEYAFVMNGDTFLECSLAALENEAVRSGCAGAIALAAVDDVARYGAVTIVDGKVRSFQEKGGAGPGYINAGCYYFGQAALERLTMLPPFSLETELLLPLAEEGGLAAFRDTAGFIDIGVPEDYARAQSMFGAGK